MIQMCSSTTFYLSPCLSVMNVLRSWLLFIVEPDEQGLINIPVKLRRPWVVT